MADVKVTALNTIVTVADEDIMAILDVSEGTGGAARKIDVSSLRTAIGSSGAKGDDGDTGPPGAKGEPGAGASDTDKLNITRLTTGFDIDALGSDTAQQGVRYYSYQHGDVAGGTLPTEVVAGRHFILREVYQTELTTFDRQQTMWSVIGDDLLKWERHTVSGSAWSAWVRSNAGGEGTADSTKLSLTNLTSGDDIDSFDGNAFVGVKYFRNAVGGTIGTLPTGVDATSNFIIRQILDTDIGRTQTIWIVVNAELKKWERHNPSASSVGTWTTWEEFNSGGAGTAGVDGDDGADGASSLRIFNTQTEGAVPTAQDYLLASPNNFLTYDSDTGTLGNLGGGWTQTYPNSINTGLVRWAREVRVRPDGTNLQVGAAYRLEGNDGASGVDGTDGTDGIDGRGVVAGGTTGQVLAKASNTDYATEWVNQTGGSGGTAEVGDLPFIRFPLTVRSIFRGTSDTEFVPIQIEGNLLASSGEHQDTFTINASANTVTLEPGTYKANIGWNVGGGTSDGGGARRVAFARIVDNSNPTTILANTDAGYFRGGAAKIPPTVLTFNVSTQTTIEFREASVGRAGTNVTDLVTTSNSYIELIKQSGIKGDPGTDGVDGTPGRDGVDGAGAPEAPLTVIAIDDAENSDVDIAANVWTDTGISIPDDNIFLVEASISSSGGAAAVVTEYIIRSDIGLRNVGISGQAIADPQILVTLKDAKDDGALFYIGYTEDVNSNPSTLLMSAPTGKNDNRIKLWRLAGAKGDKGDPGDAGGTDTAEQIRDKWRSLPNPDSSNTAGKPFERIIGLNGIGNIFQEYAADGNRKITIRGLNAEENTPGVVRRATSAQVTAADDEADGNTLVVIPSRLAEQLDRLPTLFEADITPATVSVDALARTYAVRFTFNPIKSSGIGWVDIDFGGEDLVGTSIAIGDNDSHVFNFIVTEEQADAITLNRGLNNITGPVQVEFTFRAGNGGQFKGTHRIALPIDNTVLSQGGGLTPEQEAAIAANTAKVGISSAQAQAITDNTAKRTYPEADQTKLAGIEPLAKDDQTADEITSLLAGDTTNVLGDLARLPRVQANFGRTASGGPRKITDSQAESIYASGTFGTVSPQSGDTLRIEAAGETWNWTWGQVGVSDGQSFTVNATLQNRSTLASNAGNTNGIVRARVLLIRGTNTMFTSREFSTTL